MPITKDELLFAERVRARGVTELTCVGAHVGDGLGFLARSTLVSHLYAIEPDNECYAVLCERFGDTARVTCVHAAAVADDRNRVTMWTAPGAVKFKRSNSIVVKRKDTYFAQTVNAVNIREVVRHKTAVKFDCEGCEYDLLYSVTELESQVINVIMKMSPAPFSTLKWALSLIHI